MDWKWVRVSWLGRAICMHSLQERTDEARHVFEIDCRRITYSLFSSVSLLSYPFVTDVLCEFCWPLLIDRSVLKIAWEVIYTLHATQVIPKRVTCMAIVLLSFLAALCCQFG